MRHSTLFLVSALMLSACTMTKTKEPVCSGNTLRNCQPVVYFDIGKTELTDESRENLNWVYEKMVRFPKKYVRVIGHTDSVGEADKNLVLSKSRAKAVRDYLVVRGIGKDRVVTAFAGESQPLCFKDSCREINRRVELQIFTPNRGWEPVGNWVFPFSGEDE